MVFSKKVKTSLKTSMYACKASNLGVLACMLGSGRIGNWECTYRHCAAFLEAVPDIASSLGGLIVHPKTPQEKEICLERHKKDLFVDRPFGIDGRSLGRRHWPGRALLDEPGFAPH
jgi:hypothetical protein